MALEKLVFDEGSLLNNKLLELSMENQRTIANNIANADTPGYTKFKIDYQKKLGDVLKNGNTEELGNFRGKLEKDDTNPAREDGNNVQLGQEMTDMMQNSALYSLLSKAFTTRMSIIKNAISSR